MRTLLVAFLLTISFACGVWGHEFDVVVYGATEGGVAAAVAAGRSGASVALVEPGRFVGGLLAGGRPYLDRRQQSLAGGLARELFERTAKHYNEELRWQAEPHVIGGYLRQMLEAAGVTVFREERLRDVKGARLKGGRIRRIVTDSGEVFDAGVFIDASYEGDLMAAAKVPYEILVQEDVPAADNFSFAVCVSTVERFVPFPRPDEYDAEGYDPWLERIAALNDAQGREPSLGDLVTVTELPNAKQVFIMASGSTGAAYPEATYRQRATIWQSHLTYTAGLYYFLSHDQRVPENLRRQFLSYGLCPDEFLYSNRWPHQLHIRVGRQMRGDFLLTWETISADVRDGIGWGQFREERFQAPFRVLLPPRKRVENLLVVGCPSAGPAISRELRQPASAMALGQAAGAAAGICIDSGSSVHDVDTEELIRMLREDAALLE